MPEFKSSCPKCGKPITTENGGLVPHHTVNVIRGNQRVPVKCPGTGERPN